MISGPTPSPGMRVTATRSFGPDRDVDAWKGAGEDTWTGVVDDTCSGEAWAAWTQGTRPLHAVRVRFSGSMVGVTNFV